ncbi:hypothetical protein [Nocardia cyriacigeorgica]|uniref:hypothetical protein n=1 Tax=Nocardia cyriacigeorgica TaxID=135487 RepID=UPI0034DB0059
MSANTFHDTCNEMKFPAGHCQFPTGPDSLCGAPVPKRTGPGRPALYCTDPGHNPVRRLRAARRYEKQRATQVEAPAGDLAAELGRARQLIAEAERARHGAERDAHAARRERDAALALRDLAREEAAEAISRMRADYDQQVAQVAAVADAEIARAITAHIVHERFPRKTA